jgi:hypothetical protein
MSILIDGKCLNTEICRIRKKPASDETGSLNDRVESPVRENSTENQSRNSSSKKKRVKMVSSSDSDR